MGGEIDTPDRRVAAVAARQENVVARAQVLRCGLTSRQIDRRVAAGRWRIEHRGVYVVGTGAAVDPRALDRGAAGGRRQRTLR